MPRPAHAPPDCPSFVFKCTPRFMCRGCGSARQTASCVGWPPLLAGQHCHQINVAWDLGLALLHSHIASVAACAL